METSFIDNFNNTALIREIQDDASQPQIQEKLLMIINNFNEYLNKININNNYHYINDLIIFYNNDANKDKDYTLITDKIIVITASLVKLLESKLKSEFINSNKMLIYYFIYCLNKSIIIAYSYYIYITSIKNYIKQCQDEENQVTLNKYIEYLFNIITRLNFVISKDLQIKDNSTANKEQLLEISMYESDINKFLSSFSDDKNVEQVEQVLKIIYKYICINFNLKLFKKPIQLISFTSIKDFANKYNELIDKKKNSYLEKLCDDFNRTIISLLIEINNISLDSSKDTSYITIAQYKGICWYIAMLTCMCYSDFSKKLIQSKNLQSIENPSTSNDIFTNIIIYIIKNITSTHARYDDNLTDKCCLFKYFKYNLIEYLRVKLEETRLQKMIDYNINEEINTPKKEHFVMSYSQSVIDAFNSDFIDNDEFYFTDIINELICKNNSSSELCFNDIIQSIEIPITQDLLDKKLELNPNSLGIKDTGYLILNSLYKILGIETVFLFHYKSIYYERTRYQYTSIATSPDIIFINKIANNNKIFKDNILNGKINDDIDFLTNKSEFIKKINTEKIDSEEIIEYKSIKYKLDYVIYSTNRHDVCSVKHGCGHCICGIRYDNKKYYYDSKYAEKQIECTDTCDITASDDNKISIPCSLIQQDWNVTDTKYFTINKCFLRNADIKGYNIERDFISDESMYFNKNENIICAYVKISDEEAGKIGGGSKNNYKSTHKKVNIMNDNKNIIERTIYIHNNKNKYIKFNKKYEPLSNFKFNKKNKYYYKK
jgi:hypothetical protein